MINFDQLPQDNPYALPAKGLYKAHIAEAEMRAPKDSTKKDYLNLKLTLTDAFGKGHGSIYDIISESTSPVVQFKTARFVRACGIPLVGGMELKDLAKLVKGKDIVVDVTIDNRGDSPRAQVDLFSHEAYYTSEEFIEVYNAINKGVSADGVINEGLPEDASEETPFDAPDGGAIPNGHPGTTEY